MTLIGQAVSEEQTFEYSEDIDVYCPGVGAHEPLGSQGHDLYRHCSALAINVSCRFIEIGPPVPEKKIFEGFLPYMGMVAILVM